MIVKVLSRKGDDGTPGRYAEYVGFQFMMMPGGVGMDPQTKRLVQGPPQPVAMVLVAFKDQFAIGPVADIIPAEGIREIDTFGEDDPQPEQGEEITEEQLAAMLASAVDLDENELVIPNDPEAEQEQQPFVNTAESAGV